MEKWRNAAFEASGRVSCRENARKLMHFFAVFFAVPAALNIPVAIPLCHILFLLLILFSFRNGTVFTHFILKYVYFVTFVHLFEK